MIKKKNKLNLLLKQKSDIDSDKSIIEYFSDEFAKLEINCENDYFLSNFYCDQVFENCPNENGILDIDGIIFPSVSFSYQYYNLVLHPRSMSKIKFILFFVLFTAFSINAFSQDNPDNDEMLATQYYQNKEFDKAADLYEKLFNKTQTYYYYQPNLNCLLELKSYDKAEKLIRKQMKKNPSELKYNVDLGFLFKNEGDDRKAQKQFEQ